MPVVMNAHSTPPVRLQQLAPVAQAQASRRAAVPVVGTAPQRAGAASIGIAPAPKPFKPRPSIAQPSRVALPTLPASVVTRPKNADLEANRPEQALATRATAGGASGGFRDVHCAYALGAVLVGITITGVALLAYGGVHLGDDEHSGAHTAEVAIGVLFSLPLICVIVLGFCALATSGDDKRATPMTQDQRDFQRDAGMWHALNG